MAEDKDKRGFPMQQQSINLTFTSR